MTTVLFDTLVWIAHFRRPDPVLQALLVADQVLAHPLVVLELACGTPPAPRERTLGDLRALQQAVVATADEALALVERQRLDGTGCGAVDVMLLAATLLTPGARLWTHDGELRAVALRVGVAFESKLL